MRPLIPLGCAALALGVAVPVALAAKKAPPPAPADAKPAAAPAPKAVPDLPQRVIEKKNGDFIFKVTIRPGTMRPHRLASFAVELYRALDTPDPINGDREPLAGSGPVASLQAPDQPSKERGGHSEAPPPVKYTMWPEGDPGHFVFHFTPTQDGLYQLTISGNAKASDDGDAAPFSASFRLGVGTAAADTELSQNEDEGPRRARRGDEEEDDGMTPLVRSMKQIGDRFVDLDEMLKDGHGDAAAEAKAIAALFGKVTGQVPSDHSGDGGEFDTLAGGAKEKLEALAGKTDHDRDAARAELSKIEAQSCDQCHAKYWFNVTDDVSAWPSFRLKVEKAAAE